MRQNPEGNHIILKFPRPQNSIHPLQTAGFEQLILVTLPSLRSEHCPIPAGWGGRWRHAETPQFKAGLFCLCKWVCRFLSLLLWKADLSLKKGNIRQNIPSRLRCIWIRRAILLSPKIVIDTGLNKTEPELCISRRDLTASLDMGSTTHCPMLWV